MADRGGVQDDFGARALARAGQARERARQLARRLAELRDIAPAPDSPGERWTLLEQAHATVEDARLRVAQARALSAAAHRQAARLEDRAADAGIGDVEQHRRRAGEHRAAAEAYEPDTDGR